MLSNLLIYRKKRPEFNSIENVFDTLTPYLKSKKVELPYFSKGVANRLKNIFFIKKKKATLNHISGNDHYLALGLKKRSVVLTIHDIEILKRTTGLKRYILKKLWFDFPIKNATIITTISEFSKSELLKLNNYKTPIVVIPNPLTLPIEYSPKKFNDKCPTILHLGVKKNKNLIRLIQAIHGVKCKLVIIGKEDPETTTILIKHNIEYSYKTNLTNQEVVLAYQNCDILSFISTYEGFGLPIIEAQAMGRVVLTSNCASMPEVAGKGALIVDPYSISEIKQGITDLINQKDLRNTLIQNGLENVQRFKPQKIAEKYNNVYKQITEKQ